MTIRGCWVDYTYGSAISIDRRSFMIFSAVSSPGLRKAITLNAYLSYRLRQLVVLESSAETPGFLGSQPFSLHLSVYRCEGNFAGLKLPLLASQIQRKDSSYIR